MNKFVIVDEFGMLNIKNAESSLVPGEESRNKFAILASVFEGRALKLPNNSGDYFSLFAVIPPFYTKWYDEDYYISTVFLHVCWGHPWSGHTNLCQSFASLAPTPQINLQVGVWMKMWSGEYFAIYACYSS